VIFAQGYLIKRAVPTPNFLWLLPGVLAFLSALPLALVINAVHNAWPDQPERAVTVVALLFAAILALPVAGYLLVRRQVGEAARLGLLALATVGVLLLAVYFYQVSFWVLFPADFLIWSESEFVSDILKFRVGYPLYTAQVNNESFIYTPGAPLLTYFISAALGQGTSIPAYRMIQVGYVAVAAVIALFTVRALIEARYPALNYRALFPWSILWLPLLFLIATNSLTNPFVHNLHNDALALLVSATGFFLLVKYAISQDKRLLPLMAVIPAIGFLVKQPVAIWAALYLVYLVFFDRPFSMVRIVAFGLAAFGGIIAAILGGYLLWGENFTYWMFAAAGNHDISPLRSFQHMLDTWPYFAVGLLGGVVFLRGKSSLTILGLWAVWLLFILVEVYTSGIGWTLSHLGPGSLIAGIWFVAALTILWTEAHSSAVSLLPFQRWLRYGVAVVVAVLLFSGLGLVRIPVQPFSGDAYRYVREVEEEFQGASIKDTLLDSGTWVYFDRGIVMKDRVTSIGDRGRGQTGDFSGIVQRIEQQRYSKILVCNFNSPDFWYDHSTWSEPSGIREALLNYYYEAGIIRGVEGGDRYLFSDISILIPKFRGASIPGKQ
jgi:hypothetical protein